MTAEPSSPTPPDEFLSLARRLSLLDEESAGRLHEEARAAGVLPAHLALRDGLLDAVEIDIVETMLHPHDVVPGFEILDLLGRGGMGVVFRARQNSLDRVVAIKTILVSQMHDRTALTRFEQEAQAVARLRHPNIVAAYDLGRHQGRLYFVMELVEGDDVEHYVEKHGPLDEAQSWGLLRQAASGLSHAAAAGIVHRDIKPANLLLVEPPAGFELAAGLKMVKIADFGLAFLSSAAETKTRLTSANAPIGSPHYIAPEQLEGDDADHRVDIYALGATAFQLFTGRPPFDGKKLSQIVAQKLSAPFIEIPPDQANASAASAELVRNMTHRDPARRISSYPELLSEIDRLLTGGSVVVEGAVGSRMLQTGGKQRAAATKRLMNWTNRRRFLGVVIGGVLGAGCLAVGGVWFIKGGQSPLLVPTGREVNLFDGVGLAGWTIHSGQWVAAKNDEGGGVLACAEGVIGREVFRAASADAALVEGFRLQVVVQRHAARTAELEFGLGPSETGPRHVVQVSEDGVRLGERADDQGPFRPSSEPARLPRSPIDAMTLTIERQTASWVILANDSVVGTRYASGMQTPMEFRLRAEGGEAWFSDVVVQELRRPAP